MARRRLLKEQEELDTTPKELLFRSLIIQHKHNKLNFIYSIRDYVQYKWFNANKIDDLDVEKHLKDR